MNKLISFIVFTTVVIFTTSSCVSTTGFQDARTVEKNDVELATSLSATSTPNFENGVTEEILWYPNIELGVKYGLTDRWDAGLRANSNLNFDINTKYQFLGNHSSKNAMAIGLNFTSWALTNLSSGELGGLFSFHVPLIYSYHPNDRLSIYTNPKYIYQFASGDLNSFHYFGGNLGLMYGSKLKFGLDAGFFGVVSSQRADIGSLFTVGLGFKYTIDRESGVESTESTPSKNNKPKRRSRRR